jgi:hypothetical protein
MTERRLSQGITRKAEDMDEEGVHGAQTVGKRWADGQKPWAQRTQS